MAMPRVYVAASSEYHELASYTAVTGYPLSCSVWFYTDSGALQTLMSLGDTTVGNHYHQFRLGNTGLVECITSVGASNQTASRGTITTGRWEHAAFVAVSATSRLVYLNGVAGTTATDNLTPAINLFRIAAIARNTPINFMDGRLLWPAVYSTGLSANDVLMLAKGAYPPTIRRDALVTLPRFLFDEDRDIISHAALVVGGTPTVSNDRPFQTQFVSGRARNRSRVRMSA